jgi:hypothetical protein
MSQSDSRYFLNGQTYRSKLKYVKDSQGEPTVDLAGGNANGVATGVAGATNGKQKYAFKDSGNDNFDVNPSSSDGTQGGIDSNPVCLPIREFVCFHRRNATNLMSFM